MRDVTLDTFLYQFDGRCLSRLTIVFQRPILTGCQFESHRMMLVIPAATFTFIFIDRHIEIIYMLSMINLANLSASSSVFPSE